MSQALDYKISKLGAD